MNETLKLSNITKAYLVNYEIILNTMMEEMCSAPVNCSISDNFINQMIPHHVAAIQMSGNILQFTTNLAVQSIATNIIKEQVKSIECMQAIQGQCCKVQNTEYETYYYMQAFKEVAEIMFYEMCSAPISNSINVNFVREMIPHHEGAVRMAYNALRFRICPELLPILEAIITSQCQGVKQMRKLLKALADC
ncbi:MAG: DUF305 domain-containing protein [Lysinibacillus sp.]